MKVSCLTLLAAWSVIGLCHGIPNSIIGPIFQANSPLNGQDLDDQLLAAAFWDGEQDLPGDWNEEGAIGGSQLSHLLARPRLFGQEVLMLRATRRDDRLAQLEATFVDAGSYFGYFDEELPKGLSRRELEEVMRERLAMKQADFESEYEDTIAGLRESIAEVADKAKPKTRRFGHGRLLRAEPEEWTKDGLSIRLFIADQRLVRVVLSREGEESDGWLDPAVDELSERDRLERLSATVREEGGKVIIDGIQIVPQGYKPYCGLNTLAMAARHFGLHLDEDWMAAAAGFQNTGSAGGSNMVKLYHAVAAEAGLSLDRSSKFDESGVIRALERGMPVVVWRRFAPERNRLHQRTAREPEFRLPEPGSAGERASWPGDDAPLHASVITGYNAGTGEVHFLESWNKQGETRRMRIEEMAATSYLCFVFKP
ncbi:MAG: hypothetical protein AAGI48_01555 [Verrucomicrobiota bacterium]